MSKPCLLKYEKKKTYTQKGSYPSCRPHMVKNLKVSTSWPKLSLQRWPTPRLQAGTKVSPQISEKAASPAEGSTSSSPFREKTRKITRPVKLRKNLNMRIYSNSAPHPKKTID